MKRRNRRLAKVFGLPALGVSGFLAMALVVGVGSALSGPPPKGVCHETVNPAGKPAVGDNGFPDDPFGGDAVPGGKDTTPGDRGNGPINSDGFYLVGGALFSDNDPIPAPAGFGSGNTWNADTTIKYTEWGNKSIKVSDNIGGPNSAILFHVQAPGDLYIGAGKDATPPGTFCGVPPPPF